MSRQIYTKEDIIDSHMKPGDVIQIELDDCRIIDAVFYGFDDNEKSITCRVNGQSAVKIPLKNIKEIGLSEGPFSTV